MTVITMHVNSFQKNLSRTLDIDNLFRDNSTDLEANNYD